jgi:hypothetical protein
LDNNNSFVSNDLNQKPIPLSLARSGGLMLIAGLLLGVLSYFISSNHIVFDGVMVFTYLASIGLGGLFWVSVEYVASAVWSTPMRRVFEFISSLIPVLFLLAVPLFFALRAAYEWTRDGIVKTDPALLMKAPYLNVPAFIFRTLFVLAIWSLFYVLIVRNSQRQDFSSDQILTRRNVKLSAAFIPIFGLTITAFSIDWLMSLAPDWYSTIFGVYYFSGTALSSMAAATIFVVTLNEKGYFPVKLSHDHYYNLGGLLFAFANFWAYIAFSQFMLIWYGNLPEETAWIAPRIHGSWLAISVVLFLMHFIVPFFALITRSAKMNPGRLVFISFWILAAHAVDIYWIVMPTYSPDKAVFGLGEVSALLIAAGVIIVTFAIKARGVNLVPIGDPKLKRGLEFHL